MLQERNLIENGYIRFHSASEKSTLEVANLLGKVFRVPSMPLVQTLTPRVKDNEPSNTYSGNYGTNEFPFHSDLAHWYTPPRYIFLRCVVPGVDVQTKLIDSKNIIKDVEPELFYRSHFLPRKRLDRSLNILKVYDEVLFRWDSIFIQPANKLAKELQYIICEKLSSVQSEAVELCCAGDGLLIDNWRMLHGRSSVSDIAMHRKLERVYFNEVSFER